VVVRPGGELRREVMLAAKLRERGCGDGESYGGREPGGKQAAGVADEPAVAGCGGAGECGSRRGPWRGRAG